MSFILAHVANCGQGESGALEIDGIPVDGGQLVGDTLVLTLSNNSTVNIPLSQGTIDLSSLTPLQTQALSTALRGNSVADSFGNIAGYLLPP